MPRPHHHVTHFGSFFAWFGILFDALYSLSMGLAWIVYPRYLLDSYGGEEWAANLSKGNLVTVLIVMSRFGYVMASGVGLSMAVVIFGGARTRAHLNLGLGITNTIGFVNLGFNFLGTMKELGIDSPALIGSLLVRMVLTAMNLVAWKSSGVGMPTLLMRPVNVPGEIDMNCCVIFFSAMYASGIGLFSLLRPAIVLGLFGFTELDQPSTLLIVIMFVRGIGFLILSFSALLLSVVSAYHAKTINFATLWLGVCSLGWITLVKGQHESLVAANNLKSPILSFFDFFVHLSLILACLLAFLRSEQVISSQPELEEQDMAASEKEPLKKARPLLAKSHAA